MDPSADDGGGPPTALARDPAGPPPPLAVPKQRTAVSPAGSSGASPADHPSPGQQASVPRRPTDGVAVAALVSGIIPAIPATLVLAPLALIRISRSGARGRALAITGLVLAALWTVAAAIVAAAIITRPPPPKPPALPQVFSLRAGQCLDSGANVISGVHVLSCARAHEAEVFATFRVARLALSRCGGAAGAGPAGLRQPAQQLPEPGAVRGLAGPVLRLPRRRSLVGR